MKELDLSKTLWEIITEFPEVKDIMFELGFQSIVKPGMLQTAGRYMTIPKGAKMKKIPLNEIITAFQNHGFTVKGREIIESNK